MYRSNNGDICWCCYCCCCDGNVVVLVVALVIIVAIVRQIAADNPDNVDDCNVKAMTKTQIDRHGDDDGKITERTKTHTYTDTYTHNNTKWMNCGGQSDIRVVSTLIKTNSLKNTDNEIGGRGNGESGSRVFWVKLNVVDRIFH